jgi:peptide/nickel transport system ATP-binding protein
VVEAGPGQAIYDDPQHPYTRSLLEAVPTPDPGVGRRRPINVRGEN